MRVLVLDDEDYRHRGFDECFAGHEVYHAHNAKQFKALVQKTVFDVICWDHDLGGKFTGYDCAKWFVTRPTHPGCTCLVHSWNPVGAMRIVDLLYCAGYRVLRRTFGADMLDDLKCFGL